MNGELSKKEETEQGGVACEGVKVDGFGPSRTKGRRGERAANSARSPSSRHAGPIRLVCDAISGLRLPGGGAFTRSSRLAARSLTDRFGLDTPQGRGILTTRLD